MPQQPTFSVENNFTKGLITESTGLNFPENAATDTSNCEYTLIGDVLRREGIDFETNFTTASISVTGKAISTFKWDNASGDGLTQLIVVQIGSTLYFYKSSAATDASPISAHKLASTVSLGAVVGGTFDTTLECQYATGNSYLFVYHPSMDPIYCSYASDVITSNTITLKIRDFTGTNDGLEVNTRPLTNSNAHLYNLENQGWTANPPWSAFCSSNVSASSPPFGSVAFTVGTVTGITNGDAVTSSMFMRSSNYPNSLYPDIVGYFSGTVTGYAGTILTVNVTWNNFPTTNQFGLPVTTYNTSNYGVFPIVPVASSQIPVWFTAVGNYPSNADVWWQFKNSSNVFAPATTYSNVTLNTGNAPQGHFILNAFQQLRGSVSGVSGITDCTTLVRPRTGCWFQGRVWYTGCDANFAGSGTVNPFSWTESIYFSQIIVNGNISQFGDCFQTNDPTSENLFGLLPTDGGVIQIQGSGRIFKLFPIQNGMLVFAANGVWFITGSQGIGFSANDYTITKLSNIESISSTSFVDVMGLPYFWNEEGIYQVEPQKGGGLSVNPITVGTILGFYNSIPKQSKKYVRGAYHTVDYVIQWIYKSTNDTSVTDRYSFDSILNYNVFNKSFFPYSTSITTACINGINFVQSPGGTSTPDPTIKYFSSVNGLVSFADEHDTTYADWTTASAPINYVSYFITGYKLRGQAIKKFQPQYILMYSKTNGAASAYKIKGIWDYSNNRNSGKWSVEQLITNGLTYFDNVLRRHRIRGRGYALQFKITSVDGMPFDIAGWAVYDTVNGTV